jgi:hypothetical protein
MAAASCLRLSAEGRPNDEKGHQGGAQEWRGLETPDALRLDLDRSDVRIVGRLGRNDYVFVVHVWIPKLSNDPAVNPAPSSPPSRAIGCVLRVR